MSLDSLENRISLVNYIREGLSKRSPHQMASRSFERLSILRVLRVTHRYLLLIHPTSFGGVDPTACESSLALELISKYGAPFLASSVVTFDILNVASAFLNRNENMGALVDSLEGLLDTMSLDTWGTVRSGISTPKAVTMCSDMLAGLRLPEADFLHYENSVVELMKTLSNNQKRTKFPINDL